MRSGTPMDALENGGGETQARMLEAISSVRHHESEEKASTAAGDGIRKKLSSGTLVKSESCVQKIKMSCTFQEFEFSNIQIWNFSKS